MPYEYAAKRLEVESDVSARWECWTALLEQSCVVAIGDSVP